MARANRETVDRASRRAWTPLVGALVLLAGLAAGCTEKTAGPGAPSSASARTATATTASAEAAATAASQDTSILLRTCRCGHYEAGPGKSFKIDKAMTVEFMTEQSKQDVPEAYPGAWWCVIAWRRVDQGAPPAGPLVKVEAPGLTWLDEQRELVPFPKSGRVPPPGEDRGHQVIFLGNPPYEKTLSEIVSAIGSRPRVRGRLCLRARDLRGELEAGRARADALQKRFLKSGETGVVSPSSLPKLFAEVARYCRM